MTPRCAPSTLHTDDALDLIGHLGPADYLIGHSLGGRTSRERSSAVRRHDTRSSRLRDWTR